MNAWMRNYSAMNDAKLKGCVRDFRAGYGPAVDRVTIKGGSVSNNQAKCEYIARQRGLIDSNFVPTDAEVYTPAQFCPECEKVKPFKLDDYICRFCRDGLDGSFEPDEATQEQATTQSEAELEGDLNKLLGLE